MDRSRLETKLVHNAKTIAYLRKAMLDKRKSESAELKANFKETTKNAFRDFAHQFLLPDKPTNDATLITEKNDPNQ